MLNELLNYSGLGIIFLSALGVIIEITPIQINPIQWLGKRFNAHISDEIKGVKDDVAEVKRIADERHALSNRYKIILFADEIIHKPEMLHTEEHFNQIMECITSYCNYCKTHPNFKNHKATASIHKINEIYKKCLDENSFLK